MRLPPKRDQDHRELVTRIREQVMNLEDASRKMLDNFAKIFKQAAAMALAASDEKGLDFDLHALLPVVFTQQTRTFCLSFLNWRIPAEWDQKRDAHDWIKRITREADLLGGLIESFAPAAHVNFRLTQRSPPMRLSSSFFPKLAPRLISDNPDQDIIDAKTKHTRALNHIAGHVDRDTRLEFVQACRFKSSLRNMTSTWISRGQARGDRGDGLPCLHRHG